MKTMETTVEAYEAPKVKVIEVEVEQGFASSSSDDPSCEGEDFVYG